MNKASERTQRYQDRVMKRVVIKLHAENDKDILAWLEQQPSKQGAIKEAIRKTIG